MSTDPKLAQTKAAGEPAQGAEAKGNPPVSKTTESSPSKERDTTDSSEPPKLAKGTEPVSSKPSASQQPSQPAFPGEFAGELTEGPITLGPLRDWTSADGQFHRTARYKSKGGKHVKLRKEDGTEIEVEFDRLSEVDQKWLTDYLEWRHRGRKPPKLKTN